MRNLKRFYSDDDKELLALAEYLKLNLLQLKARGDWSEMKQTNLDGLAKVQGIVDGAASLRYDLWEHLPENNLTLKESRENAECDFCGTTRKVKILGETRNKLFGWRLDKVRCKTCKKVFINSMPNNFPEIKLFMLNMIEQLTTVREDGLTDAEHIGDQMDMKDSVEQLQKFIDLQTKVENDIKAMELQDVKNRAAIEGLRDTFHKQKLAVDKFYKLDGEA